MAKAERGQKWPSWGTVHFEFDNQGQAEDLQVKEEPSPAQKKAAKPVAAATTTAPVEEGESKDTPKPTASDKQKETAAHSYPTSSKSGPKNWEKVLQDEAEEDKDNDVNQFFKSLYQNATPEQQRAMVKSMVESNGTALSTDWNDVGRRTVETTPPSGLEAKKW